MKIHQENWLVISFPNGFVAEHLLCPFKKLLHPGSHKRITTNISMNPFDRVKKNKALKWTKNDGKNEFLEFFGYNASNKNKRGSHKTDFAIGILFVLHSRTVRASMSFPFRKSFIFWKKNHFKLPKKTFFRCSRPKNSQTKIMKSLQIAHVFCANKDGPELTKWDI